MGGEIANLKRQNKALRSLVEEYRMVLQQANSRRDLYYGSYVAKDYRFTTQQIDQSLAAIQRVMEAQP